MIKTLTVIGSVMWILGLVLSILGLNIAGGTWVAIAGNILFLIGLGLMGVVWFKKKNVQAEKEKAVPPQEPQ